MSGNPFKKISPMESVLMIFVVLLLILFCIFLVRNIQMAHRRGIFSHGPSVSDILLKNRQSNRISIADADSIEAWMTFRYINFIFSIPENSFRDQLQIADNAYPNVTLWKYAKSKNLDKTALVEQIREMVRQYISLPSQPTP